jgi:hypothetical protein
MVALPFPCRTRLAFVLLAAEATERKIRANPLRARRSAALWHPEDAAYT